MKAVAAATLAACALAACAANPFSRFDDPRPEGQLSLRERSHCEDPNDPDARWCDYPHEVRAFTQKRETCDHFRGEPWPEGGEAWDIERRKELTAAMREHCTGTDRELERLRGKYRENSEIAKALAGYETDIEP